jgi:hypothetical protein
MQRSGALCPNSLHRIAEFALHTCLPTIGLFAQFPESGGLMACGHEPICHVQLCCSFGSNYQGRKS